MDLEGIAFPPEERHSHRADRQEHDGEHQQEDRDIYRWEGERCLREVQNQEMTKIIPSMPHVPYACVLGDAQQKHNGWLCRCEPTLLWLPL